MDGAQAQPTGNTAPHIPQAQPASHGDSTPQARKESTELDMDISEDSEGCTPDEDNLAKEVSDPLIREKGPEGDDGTPEPSRIVVKEPASKTDINEVCCVQSATL